MKWIHHYQLFLFDFDGILVNTELLHYKAYVKMCANRGFSLKWDLPSYMRRALYSATAVKDGIYDLFPDLKQQEPSWDVLYKEKKEIYANLLKVEGAGLMPGVKKLLASLEEANIKRCVVTNSLSDHVEFIRKQNPVLESIPYWITREHYKEPKPASECYSKAIEKYGKPGERAIGFEDSPRGLRALLGTEAEACLISNVLDPKEIKTLTDEYEFTHYESFPELFHNWED